jgi:hypothetical protein
MKEKSKKIAPPILTLSPRGEGMKIERKKKENRVDPIF